MLSGGFLITLVGGVRTSCVESATPGRQLNRPRHRHQRCNLTGLVDRAPLYGGAGVHDL